MCPFASRVRTCTQCLPPGRSARGCLALLRWRSPSDTRTRECFLGSPGLRWNSNNANCSTCTFNVQIFKSSIKSSPSPCADGIAYTQPCRWQSRRFHQQGSLSQKICHRIESVNTQSCLQIYCESQTSAVRDHRSTSTGHRHWCTTMLC